MKKILSLFAAIFMAVSVWGATYTKVTSAPQDWSGEYVLAALVPDGSGNDSTVIWTGLDAGQCHVTATIDGEGKITNDGLITITVAQLQEGGYSILVNGGTNNGKYISSGTSAPGYSNGLKFNASAHRVDFAMDVNGCVEMSQTISGGTNDGKKMYFIYNKNAGANNERFRFYKDANLGGGSYVTPFLYKKDPAAGIAVTGVALNTSTASVSVGNQITLTATVAPANADNKNISWESDDEDVATVVDGVVKGKAVGTATITVTTEDGNHTDACVVTVTPEVPFAGISYSWDGSQKSSTSSAGETGGTASVNGDANNKVGAASKLNWCLQLGKGYSSGANYIKITLDKALKTGDIITTACFVTGSSKPSTDLVYGINFEGENEVTFTYDADDETASDIPYISSNAAPENLAPIIVPAEADGKKEIWLYRKSGSTTLYVTKFIVIRPVGRVNVSSAEYATYYNADFAFTMPAGLEGIVVDAIDGNTLDLTEYYQEGDVVPAGEPLILHGAVGPYTLFAGETSDPTLKSTGDNLLSGTSTADEMTTGGTTYYRLSQHDGQVGFYWGAANGEAFKPGANKAYLAISAGQSAPAHFLFEDEEQTATSVDNIEAEQAVKFIENGQLIIIKNGVRYNALGQVIR